MEPLKREDVVLGRGDELATDKGAEEGPRNVEFVMGSSVLWLNVGAAPYWSVVRYHDVVFIGLRANVAG